MKKKNASRTMWLVGSLLLAAVCAAVRRWQIATAFEGGLGLSVKGASASVILTCLMVAAAAVLLMLSMKQPEYKPPRGIQRRLWSRSGMTAKADTMTLTLTVAAAFLSLAAAPVLFFSGMQQREEYKLALAMGMPRSGNNGLLMILMAATAVLAFLGLLLAGRDRFRGVEKGKGEAAIMLASLHGCLWLMETYRDCAADPVLWDYVPMLFAIICGMFFYMECAGLAAGAPHPRRTLWFAGMTVVLSGLALAGGGDLGDVLLLLAQSLAAVAVLWRLPVNMENPPAEQQPQGSEDEIQEENQDV